MKPFDLAPKAALGVALVLSAMTGASPARADPANWPGDTDLKAAYCIVALNDRVEMIGKLTGSLAGTSQEAAARATADTQTRAAQERLTRLRSYLLPRMTFLNPAPMAAAMAQVHADQKTLKEQYEAAGCFHKTDGASQAACLDAVVASSDAAKKLFRCDDISFLPY